MCFVFFIHVYIKPLWNPPNAPSNVPATIADGEIKLVLLNISPG